MTSSTVESSLQRTMLIAHHLRDRLVEAGPAVFGDGFDHVALGEYAGDRAAERPDHQRADAVLRQDRGGLQQRRVRTDGHDVATLGVQYGFYGN